MARIIIIVLLTFNYVDSLSAQKNIRSFIFGHSLINHEVQVNPTPSQETSVPHWFHFLAEHANHSYAVSGQYGFLPQHVNLPPIAQWGFDFVDGAWDSDYEPFSAANFSNVMITPGNFIQWQSSTENYPMESVSPVSATETIINWCNQQEDSLRFYIYENWPDMASYLNNGFPPTANEWENYNTYLNDEFHNWFIEYHDNIVEAIPNSCIKMIPVGPVISQLLNQSPFDQIPINELYEDDAPHGRASIYFLASLVTYMSMYEEKAPIDYQVESIIHPIIVENYETIVNFVWDELNNFNYSNGESRVFCDAPLISSLELPNLKYEVTISPNPIFEYLRIEGSFDSHFIDIYSVEGNTYLSSIPVNSIENKIELNFLPKGFYTLVGKSESNTFLYSRKIIKL